MPTLPPLVPCPQCGNLTEKDGVCPRCQALDDSKEQIEAIDFVLRRLEGWHHEARLTDAQWQKLSQEYLHDRQCASDAAQAGGPAAKGVCINLATGLSCWSCKGPIQAGIRYCEPCGAPVSGPAVKSLRFLRFLVKELDRREEAGLLTLAQTHDLIGETKERIRALKRKLEDERAPLVPLLVEDGAEPYEPVAERPRTDEPHADRPRHGRDSIAITPRRSVMEALLDPRSIQWLLATGGGLLVLGLVIWLKSLGLFENALVVAIGLGLANAVVLGGGAGLTLGTRYQLVGRALTLLACLVMPLNLWFYHTHNLITLDQHLWVAALVCCVIYAGSAWMLKDALFAYVLVAGVTLTGLLFLSDMQRLDEIASPATLLVILSLVCLHAERVFPPVDDSAFSRRRFGMAFFWCAQALLAAGLLLLLGAQIIGWLHEPILRHIFGGQAPAVAQREYLPWTLALVLAGTYALIYSDVVVRRIGVYIYLAAVTLLWAEIQLLILLDIAATDAIVIATLSLTAFVVNVLQTQLEEKYAFLRRIAPLGMVLSAIPVLFGVLLHLRATNVILHYFWPFRISDPAAPLAERFAQAGPYLGALAVTALCCRTAAHLYRRTASGVSAFYFFATAAVTLIFAAGLLWTLGLTAWEMQAPVLMVIPVLYITAARAYRDHTPETPLAWCAHASTIVMVLASLYVAAGVAINPGQGFQVAEVQPVTGDAINLLFAGFCLEGALFYGLAAGIRKQGWNLYLATIMLCGAIWQMLNYFHTPSEVYPPTFATLGLGLLIAYRLALLDRWKNVALSRAGYQSANALTTLGFVAGVCFSLSRLVLDQGSLAGLDAAGDWHGPVRVALYLMLYLGAVSLIAASLVRQAEWRRAYIAILVGNAVMAALLLHRLIALSPWQMLEVCSCLAGTILLIVGHIGWYREPEDRTSDTVSLALFFGSFALVVPLVLATVIHRFAFEISPLDELALVAACVALLGSGIVCRIRATTLFGGVAMAGYVLMVLIYMHRFLKEQVLVGIYLMLGGALLVGLALALSFYRDRMLALPDRLKRHEGIFRVFGWR
jgi:hypothetical protein